MSLQSIMNQLIGGDNSIIGGTSNSHDSNSVEHLFDTGNAGGKVDPFKNHSKKMLDRVIFNESTDLFDGRKIGKGRLTDMNAILGDLKLDQDMKGIVESIHDITGGPSKDEIRADATKVRKLASNADKLFKGIQQEAIAHHEAVDVLKKDFANTTKQANEAFSKQIKALRNVTISPTSTYTIGSGASARTFNLSTEELKANAVEILVGNQKSTLEHLQGELEKRVAVHEKALTEMKNFAHEVEDISKVKNKYGFSKGVSGLAQDAGALEKGAGAAAHAAEGAPKFKAGNAAAVGIVAATTALGAVVGHQADKEDSKTMAIGGGFIGFIGGLMGKNLIARTLGFASHAAAHVR